MSPHPVSRRVFLGASTAAVAALAPGPPTPTPPSPSGSSVPAAARALLNEFLAVNKECNAELTAVCDIWSVKGDSGVAAVKKASGKEPRAFKRLEDLLAWNGLDGVIVATPDHSHAKLLAMCLQAGKHVYCEKPFANVLDEGNATLDLWRRTPGKAVTIGTQCRSDPRFLAAADLVRTNVLGPVVRVDIVQNHILAQPLAPAGRGQTSQGRGH